MIVNTKFKLVDSNIYPLVGTNERYWHMSTTSAGLRTFLQFFDAETNKMYLEELKGGQLEFIDDDIVFNDLGQFLNELKLLDLQRTIGIYAHTKSKIR